MSNIAELMNNIEELAKELKENWIRNYTLSGYSAFIENENKKNIIITKAKELGIHDEVYNRANEMMKGQ